MSGDQESALQGAAEQLELLLEELRAMVAPPAYTRVEQIIHHVVTLYGNALGRTLDHARSAGVGDGFDARVCDDDLLASLLVIHGLHPLPLEQRLERAIAKLQAQLGADAPELELDGIDETGTVHVRAARALGGGAVSARVAESIIRRTIVEAAPEVIAVEIDAKASVPDGDGLVQIRRAREARR